MQTRNRLAALTLGLGSLVLNSCTGSQNWAIRQTKAQSQAAPDTPTVVEDLQQSYETRQFVSGSMEPTLEVDDRVFVDKSAYLEKQPKRGDIILYSLPVNQGKALFLTEDLDSIHRIIGLPGETIAIEDGHVVIDNQVIKEDYLLEPMDYRLAPTVIPNGNYFVLGDNRNSSPDSHIWGTLSQDRIIGQVVGVVCPPERQKLLVPSDSLSTETQKLWSSGTEFYQKFYSSGQSCDVPSLM